MKILYSCLSKSWGGMEMFTITAVKQLLKKNIQTDLLCIEDSRIHIEANNIGVIIHPIKASGYFHPGSTLKVASLIRKNNYSLIHTQASKDLWILVPALKLINYKTPLILTKQVGSFINKTDKLHTWLYSRVTKAFAISNLIKNNLLETTPLKEDQIELMHNGINTNRFHPEKVDYKKVRNEFNIKDDEIVLGMLARFSPGKGHEEFLAAAKELSKIYNNLKFMVVGEASRGEDEYANSIKKIALDSNMDNIIFTGFRADTPEVLSAMDIFVFPSHSEAFGIALAEAMALAKPSVSANTHGIPDLVDDGVTGFLFEKKNVEDLTNKLEVLINSPEKRKEFGSAARKKAIQKFDIEKLTEKAINIYNNLVNN